MVEEIGKIQDKINKAIEKQQKRINEFKIKRNIKLKKKLIKKKIKEINIKKINQAKLLQQEIRRRKLLLALRDKERRPVNITRKIEDKIPPAFSNDNSIIPTERNRTRWL